MATFGDGFFASAPARAWDPFRTNHKHRARSAYKPHTARFTPTLCHRITRGVNGLYRILLDIAHNLHYVKYATAHPLPARPCYSALLSL